MDIKKLQALISLVDDTDEEVSSQVVEELKSSGKEAIELLEKYATESASDKAKSIIQSITDSLRFKELKKKLKSWSTKESDDILKGLWILSTYIYPNVSLSSLKKKIEQIYYEVWVEFKTDIHSFDQIKKINSVLFDKLGFKSNTSDFYDPSNSMINDVIEKKLGNPVSLCTLYMIIARKLKLPVSGVNLPYLFILIYEKENASFYINAFNKGLIFSKQDVHNYLTQLKIPLKGEYYLACDNVTILRRLILNLIQAFSFKKNTSKIKDLQELLEVLDFNEQIS